MSVDLALYQPDIPQNTGTLLRLGACWGIRTHIIHPTGFGFSEKNFKRAAMDYADSADYLEHASFGRFLAWTAAEDRRLVLLTTKACTSAYEYNYTNNDVLMVGRESAGVPDEVAAASAAKLRIPMRTELRSINVAISAAVVLAEALRQTEHFKGLQ